MFAHWACLLKAQQRQPGPLQLLYSDISCSNKGTLEGLIVAPDCVSHEMFHHCIEMVVEYRYSSFVWIHI